MQKLLQQKIKKRKKAPKTNFTKEKVYPKISIKC